MVIMFISLMWTTMPEDMSLCWEKYGLGISVTVKKSNANALRNILPMTSLTKPYCMTIYMNFFNMHGALLKGLTHNYP